MSSESIVRSLTQDPGKFSDFCAGIGYSCDSIVRTLVDKFHVTEGEARGMAQDSIERMERKFGKGNDPEED